MKKIFSRVVLLLLLVSLITVTACGSGNGTLSDVTTDEYYGRTVNILSSAVRYNADTAVLGMLQDTPFAVLAQERIAEVEEEYGITINITELANKEQSLGPYLTDAVLGLASWDISLGDTYTTHPYMRAGYFEPITQYKDIIDYTDSAKWGTKYQLESALWDGDIYAVVPCLWPNTVQRTVDFPLVFNSNILEGLGLELPNALSERGEWTKAKLLEYITLTTDPEIGRYGLSVRPSHLPIAVFFADGNTLVVKDDNGDYQYGFNTEQARASLEFAKSLLDGEYSEYVYLSSNTAEAIEVFSLGNSALLLTHNHYIYGTDGTVSYDVDKFGVVCMPSENGKKIGSYEAMSFSIYIPSTAPDYTMSAVLIDAIWGRPLEGYETADDIKNYDIRYTYHYESDHEIISEMAGNARYDFFLAGVPDYAGRKVFDTLTKSQESLSTIIESLEDQFMTFAEEYIVPVYETREKLWNE